MRMIKRMALATVFSIMATAVIAQDDIQDIANGNKIAELSSSEDLVDAIVKGRYG